MGKLTALAVSRAKGPGLYGDGDGLWLRVTDAGSKSWMLRFMLRGRARSMGLGSASLFSLAEARERALTYRRMLADGRDPIETRRADRSQQALDAARALTFDQCAAAYIEAHKAGWKNAKHGAQWQATLDAYASPAFGKLPVAEIDTGLVLKALEPIWSAKPETASRVRGRVESVLDWARTRGYRTGENPARWKGHLSNLLAKRSKVQRVEHHAALPFPEVPAFVKALAAQPGVAARALAFTVHTAARTGETIGANWAEVDTAGKVWTIPADRMKAGVEHRVPLTPAALAILADMAALRRTTAPTEPVFPGGKAGRPLSNMAMLKTLERMKRDDLTVHGFRSSFRDWASERTSFPKEVAEAALAHAIENKVEAAYRRGDLFEKRRRLMEAWSGHVERGEAKGGERVVGIRR